MKAIALAAMVAAGPAGAVTLTLDREIPGDLGSGWADVNTPVPNPGTSYSDPLDEMEAWKRLNYRIKADLTIGLDVYMQITGVERVVSYNEFGEPLVVHYATEGRPSYALELFGQEFAGSDVFQDDFYTNPSSYTGWHTQPYEFTVTAVFDEPMSFYDIWMSRNSVETSSSGRISGTITYTAVPLPASGLLLLAGLGGLAAYRKKWRGLFVQ